MGGWRIRDVEGSALMDLPETLVEDLLTWRSLVDIARHQKDHPTSIPDGSGLGVKET